jgi:hypothetical protein
MHPTIRISRRCPTGPPRSLRVAFDGGSSDGSGPGICHLALSPAARVQRVHCSQIRTAAIAGEFFPALTPVNLEICASC